MALFRDREECEFQAFKDVTASASASVKILRAARESWIFPLIGCLCAEAGSYALSTCDAIELLQTWDSYFSTVYCVIDSQQGIQHDSSSFQTHTDITYKILRSIAYSHLKPFRNLLANPDHRISDETAHFKRCKSNRIPTLIGLIHRLFKKKLPDAGDFIWVNIQQIYCYICGWPEELFNINLRDNRFFFLFVRGQHSQNITVLLHS